MNDMMRLNAILRSFYYSSLTTKDKYFKRKTLNGISYGLTKHLKTNVIAIIDDPVSLHRGKFFSPYILEILYSSNHISFTCTFILLKVCFELMFY